LDEINFHDNSVGEFISQIFIDDKN
jgi:hypothetical protein